MRIQILSDIHIEFGNYNLSKSDADVICIAGDLGTGSRGLDWIKNQTTKPVIYVFGNHEFYNHDISLIKQLSINKPANVFILENKSIEINNVVFYGATLWTDFLLYGSENEKLCKQNALRMNDYHCIKNRKSLLTADIVQKINLESVNWLVKESRKKDKNKKSVIVTHHAPSTKSIHEKYKSDILNSSFSSNLDDLVIMMDADVWIHGHTHTSFNYNIGKTNIICNPRGYPHEITGFNDNLIIEI